MTGVDDCRVDPGVLTGDDAVRAMSVHYGCPPQCLPRCRAEDAMTREFVKVARIPGEWDADLAEKVRQITELL
ncbi:hypothetical protein [Nocardia sp. NPDC049707]|uniref:hypothetical protein n=1 Tax=Nocardia sp. NPDC049707 TaxID=3154735 RepID=UPI0034172493